jgi:hypothetical protein
MTAVLADGNALARHHRSGRALIGRILTVRQGGRRLLVDPVVIVVATRSVAPVASTEAMHPAAAAKAERQRCLGDFNYGAYGRRLLDVEITRGFPLVDLLR